MTNITRNHNVIRPTGAASKAVWPAYALFCHTVMAKRVERGQWVPEDGR